MKKEYADHLWQMRMWGYGYFAKCAYPEAFVTWALKKGYITERYCTCCVILTDAGRAAVPPRGGRLTAKMLETLNACSDQVVVFRKTFPRGMEWSRADLRKAEQAGLHVLWAVGWLDRGDRESVYDLYDMGDTTLVNAIISVMGDRVK